MIIMYTLLNLIMMIKNIRRLEMDLVLTWKMKYPF